MSGEKVLVTGGAGFIGSHLVDRLVAEGRSVRVLDSLEPQVHGTSEGFRNPGAEYAVGSVTDRDAVAAAMDGAAAIVHLAAQVGVGQSMYDITRYVRDNVAGTAVVLDELVQRRDRIRTLIVASSMSIYGEGRYSCSTCGTLDARVERTLEALRAKAWEPTCVECGSVVTPLPTHEGKTLECDSVYAVTKRDQEELCLVTGRAYGIRTVALRFFNVYGPRQSLSNPYTGVAAIFSSRLLNGNPPLIFEDGGQTRDFIHVSDIVEGIRLALERDGARDVALNIGTGVATSVREVARVLGEKLGVELAPEVVNKFRHGDIRHCVADIALARKVLGYEPAVSFEAGMAELVGWLSEQAGGARDRVAAATDELAERGLIV